jgi:urocanate hydratase
LGLVIALGIFPAIFMAGAEGGKFGSLMTPEQRDLLHHVGRMEATDLTPGFFVELAAVAAQVRRTQGAPADQVAAPEEKTTFEIDNFPTHIPQFQEGIRRAPRRNAELTRAEKILAIQNALRYIPPERHEEMAQEFAEELETRGRIYGYRFRPEGRIYGKPIDEYEGKCLEGRAFQVMIDNNLDFLTALYPYELVTYGESGQVCQNWMQYGLIKKYLEQLDENHTLVVMSGHPLGVFPSSPSTPRVIITNGLMVGQYDSPENFARAAALGVTNYGQMTAGGWMYIGPQGIVHGTFNTLQIAGRKKLGIPEEGNLSGKLFLSSGLGGMSAAQGKGIMIAEGVGIIAEVDPSRIRTRKEQGWITEVASTPEEAFAMALKFQAEGRAAAIAYQGNIVDLLQYAVQRDDVTIDLLSDQTSCHAVYDGGYCPQGITFEERTRLLRENGPRFRELVDVSLRTHFKLIQALTERGTQFFDYGNSFMKAVLDAGVTEIAANGRDERDGFIWPSYVEEFMGPELFDYGYGPFRWVCLSGQNEDLEKTDAAAAEVIAAKQNLRCQDRDNLSWIRNAAHHKLVVGTQARILYQDAEGRMKIALRFNQMVRDGIIGPIMLGRDHHDTGGTDSPLRETANIRDGSNITADMAVQCAMGNAARGMSLVALHNGGGVGTGKAINGGFGLVLDGSARIDEVIRSAFQWDVMVGVARRSWARNPNAMTVVSEYNEGGGLDHDGHHAANITMPHIADPEMIARYVAE